MAPRRRPATESAPSEPPPVDPPQNTARTTRGNSRTTAPQQEPSAAARVPSHSTRSDLRTTIAQDAIQRDPGRGFAPLTAQAPQAGSRNRTGTPATPPVQVLQPIPQTPPRPTPGNQQNFPPPTPGRAVANRLLSRLNTQTSMASPGPPLRDQSDEESGEDDEDPEHINLNPHSDLDASPPPCPSRFHRRLPAVQPLTQVNDAVAHQQQQGRSSSGDLDPWTGYNVDNEKFAWAQDAVLKKNSRSADCQAFFGEHIEHGSFKCKLCSLTTRRGHLAKAHEPQYLELIQARGLPNKLPNVTRRQREEARARAAARTVFSIQNFEDQLATVIVSNDLLINLIENRDFRDLWLLLRESLQDTEIPRRTKLRERIMDAWLKYYTS
ncbi:hypothetical protein B0H19DRAFT_1275167 [Mycena capillaripes]|nr:hypothetical protein B0H19DRAFT_1275167 [Mycena capillaripes]